MKHGYNQRILHVNLSNSTYFVEEPNENFYRKYIGNGIMGAYYLLKHTKAGIDALSSENLLMFLSGAVCGHEAPGLARFVVCAKSPLTGGIGESRCEGGFAVALKESGFDAIILSGACKAPSCLVIDNGEVKVEPAAELWGRRVGDATDRIEESYPGAQCAVIGPAGENLVRYANIISGRCHQASRGGMGAVMGSKKLKAVVLRGGRRMEVFDRRALEEKCAWFEEKMRANTLSMWQHDRPGFGVWIHTHGIDASLCVNNYQSAACSYTDSYTPEKFAAYYRGDASCPGCPNNCIKQYADADDDFRAGGMHQEIIGAMGPNMGISDVQKIIRANVLCNELGMDPNSLGYTLSFAQECVQRGLLDPGDLDLSFSDRMDLLPLIQRVALRQGIGDLLAEGSSRAAAQIGGGAPQYAMTVKQNEMTAFEARSQTNLALGFAVAAVGPRYEICEHDWDFDTRVGWDHTLDYCRTLGILERIPMEYLGKDKVRNYKMLSNLWSAADGLGICLFATAPTRVYSLEDMAELVHIVTGWETSSYEVMRVGELRNQIFRCYNNREGLGAKDDTLPDRFFDEEIDFGGKKGVRIDRRAFRDAIQCYYEMMGWNEAGELREATLYEYGLDWV